MPAALALLASLLWGTADFLGGTATRRLAAPVVVGVSQLVALLGLLPVALVLGAFAEPLDYVGPGMLAGLAGVLALAAFYRALAVGTMGVVAPVAALGVVVPVAAGLVAGEAPSSWQLAGIGLAVVGVVLASGPELSGRSRGGALPLVLAAVAALGFGAVFVLLAEASEGGSVRTVVMTLLTMRLVSVAVLAVLLAARRTSQASPLQLGREHLPMLVAIGVFDVGANGAFAVASQSDLVSVTAVLASLYPVVTVLLARRVHGERMVGVQLPGVVLALGGVMLLSAG
jgi:drug/metabolite transporter (DMT)-like permease